MKVGPLSLKSRALLVRRKPRLCLAAELVPSRALLERAFEQSSPPISDGPRRLGNGGAQQGSDARSSGPTFIEKREE